MSRKLRIPLVTLLILALTGAAAFGGWIWYDTHVDRSGWVQTDEGLFYKDFHGKKVSGWQEIDGNRYHFDDDSLLSTGWLPQGGDLYYLGSDGIPDTGWQEIGEHRYHFSESGSMDTGWLDLQGDRYYLDDQGILRTGWLELQKNRYYLDGQGIVCTGWAEIDGSRYYFDTDGIQQFGWLALEEGRYYLNELGNPLTGFAELEDQQYLFSDTGLLTTGWAEWDGRRRYFTEDGPMATGWLELAEGTYYLGDEGIVHTGWLQRGEYRHYFYEDGRMAVGPAEIDGQTCYFTPKGIHVVLVNASHPAPSDLQLDLVGLENNQAIDRSCYDALMALLAACKADGCNPQVTSGYRSYATQYDLFHSRVNSRVAEGESYDSAYWAVRLSVAVPGTSEHHLGLAADISGYGGSSTNAVYDWLAEHCWEYGFILRYLDGKSSITGIIHEPWHVRYVGTEVSMDMKDTGLCLEEYLGAAEASE